MHEQAVEQTVELAVILLMWRHCNCRWIGVTHQTCSKTHRTQAITMTSCNERDGVSNHLLHDCLLNRLFKAQIKETPKLRVNGLCEGNSLVTGEFPAQRASNAENVSIWWRHYGYKPPGPITIRPISTSVATWQCPTVHLHPLTCTLRCRSNSSNPARTQQVSRRPTWSAAYPLGVARVPRTCLWLPAAIRCFKDWALQDGAPDMKLIKQLISYGDNDPDDGPL